MSFAIVTDSPANLPLDLICRNGLMVIPLSYSLSGTEHTCLAPDAFDSAAFFHALKQKAEVSTSMIPPQRFVEYMEPLLQSGLDILFVSMSSGVSSSCSCAQIAAQQLQEAYPDRTIRIVDSLGSSLGEGLLVLRAFQLRARGMSLQETADTLTALRSRICQIFTVDDLMYLTRGGRLSGARAVLGTMLSIKPILKGNDQGKIVMAGKVRGRSQSIKELAKRYEEQVAYPGDQIVGIAHGNCPEDAAALAELLGKSRPPKEILIVPFDPVNGAHAGPGSLALFFEGGEDARLL